MNKVFGIGLSRTGTSSLNEALRLLGLECEHYFFDLDRLTSLDGGTDTPIARAWPALDRLYPGSRFVLTIRERAAWLDSCRRHFASLPASPRVHDLRMDLYGTPVFDEARFRAAWDRHLRAVACHFRRRPDDCLVLDLCGGEGWERLCPFLGREIPDLPFPNLNASLPSPRDMAAGASGLRPSSGLL